MSPALQKNSVLVDTSVWIDFFSARLSQQNKETLLALLESENVVITDVIRHELLVGASNEREYLQLSRILSVLTELNLNSPLMEDFHRFGFEMKNKKLLGKYTDLSIAFLARTHRIPVFSFDQYFARLAKKKIISSFN